MGRKKQRPAARASRRSSPSRPSSLSRPSSPSRQLLRRVQSFIEQHSLIPAGARVLAAVSGGSDSVALAHLLAALDASGDLHFVGLAHFNHQLRAAADADERFVADLAAALGRPLIADRADVSARASRERRSIEDAARASRHEFLERARIDAHADVIALGHTRDDQAETFLLRLTRGAGFRGLAGMHPRNGAIVRPLLDCRRDELRAYLAARGIGFVEDESNADVGIPRNRVRAELLPLLAARFNPAIVDVLASEAELARDAGAWMDAAAREAAGRIVRAGARETGIDAAGLTALPRALQRLVALHALQDRAGVRPVAFDHVEALVRLTQEASGTRIDLPGQHAQRIGDRIVLTGRPDGVTGRWTPDARSGSNLFWHSLSIPGEVLVPAAGCCVTAAVENHKDSAQARGATVGSGSTAVVRGDLCGGPLAVRNRRPGDGFRPVGLNGRKTLQDFFVDRKIARATRDAVPLVVDETDRIVWVAGYGIDEAFRVTDPTQGVIILKLKALGGSA
jgi:tRNA(Ile)-lysidine synthase